MLQRILTGVDKARREPPRARSARSSSGCAISFSAFSDNSEAVTAKRYRRNPRRPTDPCRCSASSPRPPATIRAALHRLSQRDPCSATTRPTCCSMFLAESGVEIPDSPYIQFALDAARDIEYASTAPSARPEKVVEAMFRARRTISFPATQPAPLHASRAALPTTEAARFQHQEAARKLPGFFRHDLHRPQRLWRVRQPERLIAQRQREVEWNLEHARAGQIFDFSRHATRSDDAALCLKAYRPLRSPPAGSCC